MNKNYAIINDSGTVVASTYVQISQGNNKVDELYIGYENYTSADGYVTVSALLPDNTALPELSTSNAEFHYGSYTYNTITHSAKDYEGFKIVLTDAFTSQAGTLKLTIRLKNNTTNTVLCSSEILFTIHSSVTPSTPTITDAQLDTLNQAITDNYNTLNTNKLDKRFTNYAYITTINENNDKVILNQSNEPKYAKVKDLYNIETVNEIAPVEKNITLTSANIPHGEGTVSSKFTSVDADIDTRATKSEVKTKVGSRDGELNAPVPNTTVYTGLLPYTFTKVNNKKVQITLDDGYDFKVGDIVVIESSLSGGLQLANGGFYKVINSTDYSSVYNCLFAGTSSIGYDILHFDLINGTLTLEFTTNEVFSSETIYNANVKVMILRP